MDSSKNKIIGAFLIGFAIVAGAYTVKNFGRPTTPPPEQLSAVVATEAPSRVFIEVADADNNGLEDWRDEFVKNSTVSIITEDESYIPPDTLTGQVGIAFLQSIISAEGYAGVGRTKEQVIADTAEQVKTYGSDTVYDVKGIIISNSTSSEDIRRYGNAMADAIIDNSVPGLRNEILILQDFLRDQNEDRAEELRTLAQVYLNTRNETLSITAPSRFAKEHLDLINVYHALYNDIDSMSKAKLDPMLSLVRIKRYEDDAKGLAIALQNMYKALEPHAGAFERDDSALLFGAFSAQLQ